MVMTSRRPARRLRTHAMEAEVSIFTYVYSRPSFARPRSAWGTFSCCRHPGRCRVDGPLVVYEARLGWPRCTASFYLVLSCCRHPRRCRVVGPLANYEARRGWPRYEYANGHEVHFPTYTYAYQSGAGLKQLRRCLVVHAPTFGAISFCLVISSCRHP
jgi:hypothetical protein